MSAPLAYHITFGTYGTRLHGDERGTVDRRHNTPGNPVLGSTESWQNKEQQLLKNLQIVLTHEQCTFTETSLPDICRRGDWTYHIAAAQEDHVHVLLESNREGKAVRRWLKSWLSEALSHRWPLGERQRWWAVGGSVKYVWDADYFDRVFDYIQRQRTTP